MPLPERQMSICICMCICMKRRELSVASRAWRLGGSPTPKHALAKWQVMPHTSERLNSHNQNKTKQDKREKMRKEKGGEGKLVLNRT